MSILLLLLFKVSFLECFLLFVKVVAVAVFLALGFAFYVFFAPFVGKKLFQYIVMGLYTPLVSPLSLSMSTFFGSVEELRSILSLLLVSHSCFVVRFIFPGFLLLSGVCYYHKIYSLLSVL